MRQFLPFLLACSCVLASPCTAENQLPAGVSNLPLAARAPVTQLLSKAQLLASGGAQNNEFGFSVAINAEGNTIVVGAPNVNSFEGSVYVFVKPSTGWANATQTTTLSVPGLSSGAELGEAVAISSDGNTIVASSPGSGIGGAAYVFSPVNGSWSNGGSVLAELIASDAVSGLDLGSSVAISSNGETVVAGAVNATIGKNPGQGAVYVFTESTTGWSSENQAAKLTASNGIDNQNLGSAVAISGNTIVAGAWDYAEGEGGPGAVYVFTKTGSSWTNMTQTAELTASDGRPLDVLGLSVSISGNTIVAGAPNHQVGSNTYQGALYVWVEPASGWANAFQTAELTASNGVSDGNLGQSVAIAGDFIVGGADCQQVGSNFCQGELYAYAKPASGWANGTETYDLTAKGGAAGDELGWSASLTTSGPIAIGGAFGYKSYTGAVYVFEK